MTVHQFRRMALSLPEVEARAHMQHPDFRVGGKVFATLGYPDKSSGMIRLTPEQQRFYVQAHPSVFVPAAGAWGRQGCTLVRLKTADADVVQEAMKEAWLGRAPKKLIERIRTNGSHPVPSPQPLAPYFLGTQVNSPQAVCWTRQVLTSKLRKDSEWPVIFRDVRESTSKRTVREQSLVSFPGGALGPVG